MEKLLRILFVMCAIAFVTTATACADDKTGGNDKTTKTGGNDKTAKTGGDDKTANAGGNDKTANTGGNDKTANAGGDANTAKTPSIFLFSAEVKGVTIDKSKDVYKITINPSLLTYATPTGGVGVGVAAMNPAPIFTVTFKDDTLQGFIIPTTDDKAEALSTTHVADLHAAELLDTASGVTDNDVDLGAPNNVTHSFLADANPGFSATEINADWSTRASRAKVVGGANYNGVANILSDTKVRVSCSTTITGPKAASFTVIAPAPADDLPIAIGTETECFFSLVPVGGVHVDDKPNIYKTWAKAAVELAKDDATKNIQKMGFVGIVTGDATASEITTAAGITEDADALGVKGFTADASAKLVKAYNSVLQKVEIVIAAAK